MARFRRLLSVWPLGPIRDHIAWLRRGREERVVATAQFETTVVSDTGTPTGVVRVHILLFLANGNGVRSTRVESTSTALAGTHGPLLTARMNWIHHNELPSNARRTDDRPRGTLVLLPGGPPRAG